jgi:hypothetical protein
MRAAEENAARLRNQVQQAARTTSVADELHKLADLRNSGVITTAEYEQAKAKVLSAG